MAYSCSPLSKFQFKLWSRKNNIFLFRFSNTKENLYAGQEQQLELYMKQWTGSKLGKEYVKAVYCHPAYLTYMQSTSCEMTHWMKHKLESRLLGEISITSDMQMTPPLWQKAERNWRASWWRWKRRVEKTASKLNIQNIKIMASGPITSWQIDGETMETVRDLFWKLLQMVTAAMKLKDACLLEEKLWPTWTAY